MKPIHSTTAEKMDLAQAIYNDPVAWAVFQTVRRELDIEGELRNTLELFKRRYFFKRGLMNRDAFLGVNDLLRHVAVGEFELDSTEAWDFLESRQSR